MFRELILQTRRTLQQHHINIEQEWINVQDFASAQLYKAYFDNNYNRFGLSKIRNILHDVVYIQR